MPITHSHLAHKFAQDISQAFKSSPTFLDALHAMPQYEHKAVHQQIRTQLEGFLKTESTDSTLSPVLLDWEGNANRPGKQEHSYPILGTWTHPDAAILSPFRCAFEFDREAASGSVSFKTALMKASVHVLSGAYDACVFVFILRPGPPRQEREYLEDNDGHTQRLIQTLQANGLHIALITSSTSQVNKQGK